MSIVSGGQEGAWQVAACKGVRSWVERMEETVMAELATLKKKERREGAREGRRVGEERALRAGWVLLSYKRREGGREGARKEGRASKRSIYART